MKKSRNFTRLIFNLVCILILSGCTNTNKMPGGSDATWDLVIIGDSFMWELGEAYAARITKDTGVKVVVHDFALNTLSAGELLEVLQTGKSSRGGLEPLPEAIKEAEVVVMFVNPLQSIIESNPLDLEGCFGVTEPKNCEKSAFLKYEDDIKSIWKKIIELRGNKPIILRATDIYNPAVKQWKSAGIKESCDICWSNMSDANRQAAESLGIPFLSRFDAYGGPNHDEDPGEKGYIREDGEHPTPEGAAYTAQLLSEMGYEPTTKQK